MGGFVVRGGRTRRWLVVAAAVGLGLASSGCVRVSRSNVTSAGGQTTGAVASPAVSADGQVVAFVSDAPNLVPDDTNGVADVFVHDHTTGWTERVSKTGDGAEKLFATDTYALSPDGRRVAFEAIVGELIPGTLPPVAFRDWVGVYDRASGNVSVPVSPTQTLVEVAAPQYLDDGFLSTRQTMLVGGSAATARFTPFGACADPSLVSGDGHWCVQSSTSPPGLLLRAPGAAIADVVLDTELTTDGAVPTAAPTALALSRTGRFVAFVSTATNHVAGDGNGVADVFVVDRDPDADGVFDEGTSLPVERVSVAAGGADANVASNSPALSADGRYVVFVSNASNLVPGDTNATSDVFRYDRSTGTTERVSVANGGGAQGSGPSFAPAVDAGARTVVFLSGAANLVAGDTNGATDVFRRTLGSGSGAGSASGAEVAAAVIP